MNFFILLVYVVSSGPKKPVHQYSLARDNKKCEDGIEKSVPRITDWHHDACQVTTISDQEERFFLSHPHTNNRYFFLLTIQYCYSEKGFHKFLNTLRRDISRLHR